MDVTTVKLRNRGVTITIADNTRFIGKDIKIGTSEYTERDEAIIEAVNAGGTGAALARAFGVSRQRIKQITDRLIKEGKLTHTTRTVMGVINEHRKRESLEAKYGTDTRAIDEQILDMLRNKLKNLQGNAKRRGNAFDLRLVDLMPLPTHCPVIGIKLNPFNSTGFADDAISIDRVIPDLGYVKGNIVICSFRANRIKNDATVEELGMIYNYYLTRELTNQERVSLDSRKINLDIE